MTKLTHLALITAGGLATLSTMGTAAALQVREQAQVPGRNGAVRTVQLLKSGKHLETVTCRDFGLLDESFRPQAVVYAANYGPKGKAHPDVTVDGIERVVPIVVQQCAARPGDHFTTAVQRAMAQARAK